MSFSGTVGAGPIEVTVQAVDANGNPISPSQTTINSATYTSSDPTVFTLAADPNSAIGALLTMVGPGTATITCSAICSDAGGDQNYPVSGSDTITVAAAVQPAPMAAGLVFSYAPQAASSSGSNGTSTSAQPAAASPAAAFVSPQTVHRHAA
jgi:hypothetical protein